MSKIVPAKSICGDCARATALEGRLGCDWFRERKPPYGVRYQKRYSRNGGKSSKPGFWLYTIVDCPDFIAAGSNKSLMRAQRQARLSLHNSCGFGEKRLKRIVSEAKFLSECVKEKRLTLADMTEVLKDECNFSIEDLVEEEQDAEMEQ